MLTDVESKLIHIANDVEDRVKISYILHDINSGYANAWRRITMSERPFTRLTVHEKMEHTDRFIQKYAEHVVKRFQQIPCTNIPVGTKIKPILLDVVNKTDHKLCIRTNDLTNPNTSEIFRISTDMAIIDLEPSAKIKLSLVPEWGTGAESQFYRSGIQIQYAALDEKSRGWSDREDKRPPTGTTNPTNFQLGLTFDASKGDPFELAGTGSWFILKEKLTKIKSGLDAGGNDFVQILREDGKNVPVANSSSSSSSSSTASISTIPLKYKFMGESDTISQLLYRVAYDLDPAVEWMSPGKDHFDDQYSIIRIRRAGSAELLSTACSTAIKTVDNIISAMEKQRKKFIPSAPASSRTKLVSGGVDGPDVSIVQTTYETKPQITVPSIETTYHTPATYYFNAFNFSMSTSSASSGSTSSTETKSA